MCQRVNQAIRWNWFEAHTRTTQSELNGIVKAYQFSVSFSLIIGLKYQLRIGTLAFESLGWRKMSFWVCVGEGRALKIEIRLRIRWIKLLRKIHIKYLLLRVKTVSWLCVLSIVRNCGNVFCKDCCHLKLPIPDQQLYDPVLVCNTCHDLLLESRTREIRCQQLKKAIATASSWERRCKAWPASALSCSFWNDEPGAPLWPRPAVVSAAGEGKDEEEFLRFGRLRFGNGDTLWDCLRGGNEDGDGLGWKWRQGRFSCRTIPFWSKTFSAWVAAASGCLHAAQSSSGAPSETHLQPLQPVQPPHTPGRVTHL